MLTSGVKKPNQGNTCYTTTSDLCSFNTHLVPATSEIISGRFVGDTVCFRYIVYVRVYKLLVSINVKCVRNLF